MSLMLNSEMQNNEFDCKSSAEMCHPVDGNDSKFVSGLSTILVATIQEAKDRISQVEYIFCSQLYPNFQKNSKCLQKIYSEAQTAVEGEWKVQVGELENRVKEVSAEKEQALVECSAVKKDNLLLRRRLTELEEMVLSKTKEIDEGLSLHKKLNDLLDSKASAFMSIEMEMKEKDEKLTVLLEKFRILEDKNMALSIKVQQKKDEINKEKESKEEFLRQIDLQMQKISSNEQMVSDLEKEKKQLVMQLENLEASFGGLQNELRSITLEKEESIQMRQQLIQRINKNDIELAMKDQKLRACEKEKQAFLSRINQLENEVQELHCKCAKKCGLMPNTGDFAKQFALKNAELEEECKRRKDAVTAYKKLKSQQNFLLKKLGLSTEDMMLQMKADEGYKSSDDSKIITPPEFKRTIPDSALAPGLSKVKKEVDSMESSDDDISGRLNQMSNSRFQSCSSAAANCALNKSLDTSAGIKRPAPGWRKTRSRQSPGGADPHDDFLDTPYENIRGNLQKAMQDNVYDRPAHSSKEADSDNSDDETQEPAPHKPRLKTPRSGPANFKFVEPVRKKSDRENLNGIECNQCKKFYDAVLCDAEGKDGEINKQNLRCEHHHGVSRHRYRFVPPMTPEGFWNIGFDTET